MGLHYTEQGFVERVERLGRHYGKGLIRSWEGANAFFEAALGQRSLVIEEASKSLPVEFHSEISALLTEQEEIGYESRGKMVRVFFQDDPAEMEARLAKDRPLIRETCDVLRRLLNLPAKEDAAPNLPALPDLKPRITTAGSDSPNFAPLKDLRHVEFFKNGYCGSPMIEAVTYVCSQDYPVALFGYHYSIGFRITTAGSRQLGDGDWTLEFQWTRERFSFGIWEGTPRGVVALPRIVCDCADFGNAVDELIERLVAGESSRLWLFEAEGETGGE